MGLPARYGVSSHTKEGHGLFATVVDRTDRSGKRFGASTLGKLRRVETGLLQGPESIACMHLPDGGRTPPTDRRSRPVSPDPPAATARAVPRAACLNVPSAACSRHEGSHALLCYRIASMHGRPKTCGARSVNVTHRRSLTDRTAPERTSCSAQCVVSADPRLTVRGCPRRPISWHTTRQRRLLSMRP